MSEVQTSGLQQAIDAVESLPPEDQELLIDIVKRHLIDQRRDQLAIEIDESRAAYQRGEVTRGSAEDLMRELAE
jgi:hypothetical protein